MVPAGETAYAVHAGGRSPHRSSTARWSRCFNPTWSCPRVRGEGERPCRHLQASRGHRRRHRAAHPHSIARRRSAGPAPVLHRPPRQPIATASSSVIAAPSAQAEAKVAASRQLRRSARRRSDAGRSSWEREALVSLEDAGAAPNELGGALRLSFREQQPRQDAEGRRRCAPDHRFAGPGPGTPRRRSRAAAIFLPGGATCAAGEAERSKLPDAICACRFQTLAGPGQRQPGNPRWR